jgi:hypothetical protein
MLLVLYMLLSQFKTVFNLSMLTLDGQLWRFQGALAVPNVGTLRRQCLEELHDTPYSGHFGVTKTENAVCRVYWWPTLRADVQEYIRTCDTCQRDKGSQRHPSGLLQPLPVPARRCQSVGCDLITGLPTTE